MGGAFRVLVVTSLWPRGSGHAGIQVAQLVRSMRERSDLDVRVRIIEGRTDAKFFLSIPGTARLARQWRPDVVLAVYGPAVISCLGVRSVRKAVYFLGSDVNQKWKFRLSRMFVRRNDLTIFVSDSLRRRAGLSNSRSMVLTTGVDRRIFKPIDPQQARRGLGLSDAAAVILFGGVRTVPTKNAALFDAVISQLALSLGNDILSLELSGDMSAEQVAARMQASDVLLLTSDWGTEGSPAVVREAIACGLPVVSVDVGDVSVWGDSVTVVPWQAGPGLVDALAAAVSHRLEDKGAKRRPSELPFDREAVTEQLCQALGGMTR